MNAEMLSGLGGALVSLAATYLPGVKGWFEQLSGPQKRLVLAAVLAVVAAGCVGLSCWSDGVRWITAVLGPQAWLTSCDEAGAMAAVRAWLAAVAGSQVMYVIQGTGGGAEPVKNKRGQSYWKSTRG